MAYYVWGLKKRVASGKLPVKNNHKKRKELTMNEAIRETDYTTMGGKLYLAFELGSKRWKLGFSHGLGQRARERAIEAGDLVVLHEEIQRAKKRFGLPEAAGVMSCYEAGRDGFWLHCYLVSKGVENLVVDSASIEVSRRAKRVKTDRLDVGKLLTMLMRYDYGEKKVWRVVHVPRPGSRRQATLAPAARHLEDGSDAAHQSHQGAAGGTGGAPASGRRLSGPPG
jgi:transposase